MIGRSAAMHDAVKGEHIARMSAHSNVVDWTGARTLERLFRPLSQFAAAIGWNQAKADRDSRVRPTGDSSSARQSTQEEIGRNPDQSLRGRTLEGRTPGECPAGGMLNPCRIDRIFRPG
jgi:hypothetical protein